LLAQAMAANPQMPLPRVSSVGTIAIFFTVAPWQKRMTLPTAPSPSRHLNHSA
jgi:hypothetical protein